MHDHDILRANGVEVEEEVLVGESRGGGESGGRTVPDVARREVREGGDVGARGGGEDAIGEVDVGGVGGGGRRDGGGVPGGEGDGEGAEVGDVGEAVGLVGAAGWPARGEEGERGGGAERVEERRGGRDRVLQLLRDAEDEVVGDGRDRRRRRAPRIRRRGRAGRRNRTTGDATRSGVEQEAAAHNAGDGDDMASGRANLLHRWLRRDGGRRRVWWFLRENDRWAPLIQCIIGPSGGPNLAAQ